MTNVASAATSRARASISKAKSIVVMVFSSFFVGLHWPDVNWAESRCPGTTGKAVKRSARGEKLHERKRRKRAALNIVRHRLRPSRSAPKDTRSEENTELQ